MSAIVSDSNKIFSATDNSAFYGNSFTASCWYKIVSDPNDYAYAFGNAKASSDGWNLLSSQNSGADNRKEQARVNTGSQYNALSTTARTAGVWHFIAMTFNSSTNELKLYYGNESTAPTQVGSTITTSGSMGTSGGNLTFGANPNDVTIRNQKISDCRIYNNTVRTEAQIQSDYLQRVSTGNGLTDYWKFDETSGNTADNLISARDATATSASWSLDEPAFTNVGDEINFDASSSNNATGTSNTWAHTCTGSNRILWVYVSTDGISGRDSITGVTYNGVAMTQAVKKQSNATNLYAYLYYLIAPATGANNIVVSASESANIRASAISYTGALQSGQPDATASKSETTVTTTTNSITTVVNNCWVVTGCSDDAGVPVASTNVTDRTGTGVNDRMGDTGGPVATAGAFSQTWTGASGTFTMVQASFAPISDIYTRGDEVSLPSNDTDLETSYSEQNVTDVATADNVRVAQTATNQYMIHQFKNNIGGASACNLLWEGQTTWPPSTNAVNLQIYNRNTTSWETVDTDNTSSVDTDFTLSANIANTANYVDGNGFISCRVYQQAT